MTWLRHKQKAWKKIQNLGEKIGLRTRLTQNALISATKQATLSTIISWIFGLSQMRRSFQKAVMNGNLMDSLKQMGFLMMSFLTFYMKVRIITEKSTARIGKRNIQSQSTSNSIIMNQYNYSKKA